MGSPSCGGDVTVYVWHKPTELAHSFLFCSCVYFCLYGPFNCISFHKFFRHLFVFSLCSCGLSSALLVLSTVYLFMKVFLSPDIIPSGWLGSQHQLTNSLYIDEICTVWRNTFHCQVTECREYTQVPRLSTKRTGSDTNGIGSRDSLLVKAPDSSLKGCEFESRQERHEIFLLQS